MQRREQKPKNQGWGGTGKEEVEIKMKRGNFDPEISALHVEVKIRVRGEQRESTEVKSSASCGKKKKQKNKKRKSWEIPENGEFSPVLRGGFGRGVKIRAGSSKGAADPACKQQRDQKREIKSGCDKLQPIVTAWTAVRKC